MVPAPLEQRGWKAFRLPVLQVRIAAAGYQHGCPSQGLRGISTHKLPSYGCHVHPGFTAIGPGVSPLPFRNEAVGFQMLLWYNVVDCWCLPEGHLPTPV